MKRALSFVVFALSSSFGAAAFAQDAGWGPQPAPVWAPPPAAPRPRDVPRAAEPERYTQRSVFAEAGARTIFLKSKGLDPFADGDAVTFLSLAATHPILRRKPDYLSVVAGWDFVSREGEARGVPTGLVIHRLHAGVEGRRMLGRRFAVLARVEPLLVHARAEVRDPGAVSPLVRRPWMFGGEATVGGRFELGRLGEDEEWPLARIWIGLDAGYAVTTKVSMRMQEPEDPSDPRRTGAVALPDLHTGGAMGRALVALSF